MPIYENSRYAGQGTYPRLFRGKIRQTVTNRTINRELGANAFPYLTEEGDKLFNLALNFFQAVSAHPEDLWWIIADRNPDVDPLKIEAGTVLWIPSEDEAKDALSRIL